MRGMANSIAATSNWCANFILTAMFLPITATATGKVYAFMFLGVSSIAAYLFVFKMVAETKGKSMEECVRLF